MIDRERKLLSLSSIQAANRFDSSSTWHFAWPSNSFPLDLRCKAESRKGAL